jgi:hypothetical protein
VSTLCSDCSLHSKPQSSTAATNCSGLHLEPSKWTCRKMMTGCLSEVCWHGRESGSLAVLLPGR